MSKKNKVRRANRHIIQTWHKATETNSTWCADTPKAYTASNTAVEERIENRASRISASANRNF